MWYASEGRVLGSLTIQWQSDEELLEVNRQFLDHDYYTDIITFNRNRGNRVNGDLAISVERIIDHAAQQGIAVRDEVLRVVVHGTLHLCGYDDHSDEEKSTDAGFRINLHGKSPELWALRKCFTWNNEVRRNCSGCRSCRM